MDANWLGAREAAEQQVAQGPLVGSRDGHRSRTRTGADREHALQPPPAGLDDSRGRLGHGGVHAGRA